MLAHRSFGKKGSWLPSAMISFTQIGWFGVGLAMFAIPVAKELLGLEVTPDHMPWQGYLLVAIAGILMTGSAYYGIKSLTIISYIAVPAVAILGTVAMVMAVNKGDLGLIEQFNQGTCPRRLCRRRCDSAFNAGPHRIQTGGGCRKRHAWKGR